MMAGMSNDAHLLALIVILAWLMIIGAANLRAGGSLALMFGNREAMPAATPLADRADRAAKNMLENLVLFVGAYVAAKSAGAATWKVVRGAQIFLVARVVYWGLYVAGVKYLRTVAWATGLAGVGLLVAGALAA